VPRRFTLVALWAVFAVASVSVGFAAARLVSDPFTDVGTSTDVSTLAGPGTEPVTETDVVPGVQATGTATPSTSTPTPRAGTATGTPSGSSPTRSAHPRTAPSTARSTPSAPSAPSTIRRGITTRAGYVSATCRGGLVSVGAAPAVYWWVASRTAGWAPTARVRLEPAQNASGQRLDVTASCSAGTPVFTTDFSDGGGGDGGDGGDGGGDGGGSDGSGGSGGSDDGGGSSGSGSG
jgi:hypothetical protein